MYALRVVNPQSDSIVEALKALGSGRGLVHNIESSKSELGVLATTPGLRSAAAESKDALLDALLETIESLEPTARVVLPILLGADADEDWSSVGLMKRRERACQALAGKGGRWDHGPSISTLRRSIEPSSWQLLASALLDPRREPNPRTGDSKVSSRKAVVVGGAVMDIILDVATMPEADASVQATHLFLHPGGKGLSQAVALARLGFSVELVAAIGDDRWGDEILALLIDEGVGTRFIQRCSGTSPATAVLNVGGRSSQAIGWQNMAEMSLDPDLALKAIEELGPNDCLALTFEVEPAGINQIVERLPYRPTQRPTIAVTPAPPRQGSLGSAVFGRIDFLVANDWELSQLTKDYDLEESASDQTSGAADSLLRSGVGNVCVCTNQSSVIYQRSGGQIATPPIQTPWRRSAAEADAFCAAILYRSSHVGTVGQFDAQWATAAMAVSEGRKGLPSGMPTAAQIEDIFTAPNLTEEHVAVGDDFADKRIPPGN